MGLPHDMAKVLVNSLTFSQLVYLGYFILVRGKDLKKTIG